MNNKIYKTLANYKNKLENMGYNVMYIGLYGSQNYNLDDDESDIDAKAIVLPSLHDIIFRKVTSVTVNIDDSQIDVKDVLTFYNVAKKGNYTQVDYVKSYDNWQNPDGSIRKEHISRQYYNDGQNYLERGVGGSKLYANNARGRVTVFDETAAKERERFSLDAKEYPDYPQIGIYNGVAWYNPNLGYLTNRQIKANGFVRELNTNAQENFINLEDLYKGF